MELEYEIELSLQDPVHIIVHVLINKFDRNLDYEFEIIAIEHKGEFEDNALTLPVSLLSKAFVAKIDDQLSREHTFETMVLEEIEKAFERLDERDLEAEND